MSAALESTDLPSLRWGSPGKAYMWAVEQASRPDYTSSAEVMRRQMVGGFGGRASEFGPRDFRDLAHTILTRVGNIADRHALAVFRHVFGELNEERMETVASTIAQHVLPHHLEKYPLHRKVRYSLCKRAALVSLIRARRGARRDGGLPKGDKGYSEYARAFRLGSRSSIYDGPWLALITDTEMDFHSALERAERAARQQLEPLGIIS